MQLRKLTNDEIEFRLKDLITRERKLLHIILEHIREVEVRKIFLEKAYPSMYEYLVQELGYSGSAAMRRIEASRLLDQVPELVEKIQDGKINLSQIGELARAIKEKEKLQRQADPQNFKKIDGAEKSMLLSQIENQNTRETQKTLAEALDLPLKSYDTQRWQKDESVRLEITLSREDYEQLNKCKDLAAHRLSQIHRDVSWPSVISFLSSEYLKRKTGTRENALAKNQNNASKNQNDMVQNRCGGYGTH